MFTRFGPKIGSKRRPDLAIRVVGTYPEYLTTGVVKPV